MLSPHCMKVFRIGLMYNRRHKANGNVQYNKCDGKCLRKQAIDLTIISRWIIILVPKEPVSQHDVGNDTSSAWYSAEKPCPWTIIYASLVCSCAYGVFSYGTVARSILMSRYRGCVSLIRFFRTIDFLHVQRRKKIMSHNPTLSRIFNLPWTKGFLSFHHCEMHVIHSAVLRRRNFMMSLLFAWEVLRSTLPHPAPSCQVLRLDRLCDVLLSRPFLFVLYFVVILIKLSFYCDFFRDDLCKKKSEDASVEWSRHDCSSWDAFQLRQPEQSEDGRPRSGDILFDSLDTSRRHEAVDQVSSASQSDCGRLYFNSSSIHFEFCPLTIFRGVLCGAGTMTLFFFMNAFEVCPKFTMDRLPLEQCVRQKLSH